LVALADGPPTFSDRLGGLAGGQRAFELIWNDEDLQGGIALPGGVRKGKSEAVLGCLVTLRNGGNRLCFKRNHVFSVCRDGRDSQP